ncbi:MAG: hypothetical protein P1U85_22940 [Verrucomicrobiales bacterium]|nr:hypothetical protein [Verrucomicrobiales bacterium]
MKNSRIFLIALPILGGLGAIAVFFISPYQISILATDAIEDPDSPTQYTCSKHRRHLVSKAGFWADTTPFQGTEDYWKAVSAFPCSIPLNGSLTETELHTVSAELTFCELCESGIGQHFARTTSAEQGESPKP